MASARPRGRSCHATATGRHRYQRARPPWPEASAENATPCRDVSARPDAAARNSGAVGRALSLHQGLPCPGCGARQPADWRRLSGGGPLLPAQWVRHDPSPGRSAWSSWCICLLPALLVLLCRVPTAAKAAVVRLPLAALGWLAYMTRGDFNLWDGPLALPRCGPEFVLGVVAYRIWRTRAAQRILRSDVGFARDDARTRRRPDRKPCPSDVWPVGAAVRRDGGREPASRRPGTPADRGTGTTLPPRGIRARQGEAHVCARPRAAGTTSSRLAQTGFDMTWRCIWVPHFSHR
jgi:hypothetical protein